MFLEEALPYGALPIYDIEPAGAFVMTENLEFVKYTGRDRITVPMVENTNNVASLAADFILFCSAHLEKTQVNSTEDAISFASTKFVKQGNKIYSVLAKNDNNLPEIVINLNRTAEILEDDSMISIMEHTAVPDNTIIAFPGPEFFGRMPVGDNKFGLLIHNLKAMIPMEISAQV